MTISRGPMRFRPTGLKAGYVAGEISAGPKPRVLLSCLTRLSLVELAW